MFSSRTPSFSNRAIPPINEFEVRVLLLLCCLTFDALVPKGCSLFCIHTELMLQWLASNFGSPQEISASLVVAVHAWSGRFFLRTTAPKNEQPPSSQRIGDRFQLLSQETAVFFLTRIINCLIEEKNSLETGTPPPTAALSVANKRHNAEEDPAMLTPDAKKFRVGEYASRLVTEESLPTKPLENATHESVVPVVQEFDIVVAQQPNHPGNQKFQGTNKLLLRIFVSPRFTHFLSWH
jgi:hypothetical protein